MMLEFFYLVIALLPYMATIALCNIIYTEIQAYGSVRSYPPSYKPRIKKFGHAITFFIEFFGNTFGITIISSSGLLSLFSMNLHEIPLILRLFIIALILFIGGLTAVLTFNFVNLFVEDNSSVFAKMTMQTHLESKNPLLKESEQRAIVFKARESYLLDMKKNFWAFRVLR